MCGSDNSKNKHKTSLIILINITVNANIRKSLHIFYCDEKDDANEAKRRYRLLAWKHFTEKLQNVCDFDRATRSSILKDISNVHELLSKR